MGPKYLIGLTTNVEDGAPDRPAHYSLLSIITQITRRTAAEPRSPSPSVSLPDDNITTLSADSLSDENFNPGLACLGAV